MIGAILTHYSDYFGMPKAMLYVLASIACLFAIYSFSCHHSFKSNWPLSLKGIIIANIAYCCLTLGLLIYYSQSITVLGWAYFLLEIVVVLALVSVEVKALLNRNG